MQEYSEPEQAFSISMPQPVFKISIAYKKSKWKAQDQSAAGTLQEVSTLFAVGDIPITIVTHNFWREHRLIIVDPNRPRHFRLGEINQHQLLTLYVVEEENAVYWALWKIHN